MTPDIDDFEERAAIAQHDGGLSPRLAEDLAAQRQGFKDAEAYWGWLAEYVLSRRPPALKPEEITSGSIVVLKALDELPPHLFKVTEVVDGMLCGTALTGPLVGEYGEPDLELVDRIIWQDDQ
jgi:hypothetical protein